ncbi:peroxisomal membrane protein 11B isoform X2 [Cynoglossus semilaevis]|uniref:peroxisomal membrane protein 11B isoform X2 n=1 Tax=Cynoglossus semilaevis TaxID=244447 RepID=UPI0007DC865A|nr:peroxisomal membrane protein 11B isoform X2 [Cynoglossus semilaevis]
MTVCLRVCPDRTAQYACTLLGYTLQKSGASTELRKTVSHLEAHMSLTRKLMRLGNSVEALEAAKRAIHLSDSVLRLCLTLGHLNKAMYFACDNVLWAGKTGLVSKLDQHKWSQRSFRYYLFALILNLTRDVYELRLLMESEARYRASKSPPSSSGSLPDEHLSSASAPGAVALPIVSFWLRRQLHLLVTVLYNNPPLLLDLLKNSCDIFIPLDRLGIYPTGSGFVGACGLTSSVLSILTMIHPWLKLKP